jgi:hypothetical protein
MSTDTDDAVDGPGALTENSLEMVALRRFVYSLAGYPPGEKQPDGYGIIDAVDDAIARIEELEDGAGGSADVPDDVQERLDALEDEVKRASATNDEQKASKLEKIEAVVRHAQSKDSGGIAGVQIEYGEVIAAADCSRQWAHTLMDEIGATYSWASTKAPAGKKKQLRIRTDDHSLEEMIDDIYEDEG